MNALFVNTNRVRPPIAPLALDYLADVLEAEGHAVRLLDLCWEPDPLQALRRELGATRPDLVALTFRNTDDCYFTSRCSFVSRLREDVALLREGYDGPVVIGGCGFSLMPALLLEHVGGPYGVRGDGEVGLPAFIRALDGALPLAQVPGLVYAEGGAWRQNPAAAADLSRVRLSRRAWVDNRRYFVQGAQAGIETKRGCPSRCIYCADPVVKGRRARLRPPADVVAEMRNLLSQGADCFHLCDSEFNLPPDHAEAVCRAVVSAGLGDRVRWYTYASPVPVSAGLIGLMQRAGCAGVNFGVDSGSDRMLRALGRDFTAADVARAARLCREAGLPFMFDLLLGGPGETWESVEETLDLMRRVSPSRVGLSLGVRVYPGTPLAAGVRAGDTGGRLVGDPEGLEPAFFVSDALGSDPHGGLRERVGADSRFFVPAGPGEQNYNYNDNAVLQEAIAAGHRGAYWDILRKIREAA